MTEETAQSPGPQSTADERERAAEAESYTGVPMDDQELADVWEAPVAQRTEQSAEHAEQVEGQENS